jgi:hypothetical protein
MAEAARIFVSHAHEDNTWFRTFVEALRQGGAGTSHDFLLALLGRYAISAACAEQYMSACQG